MPSNSPYGWRQDFRDEERLLISHGEGPEGYIERLPLRFFFRDGDGFFHGTSFDRNEQYYIYRSPFAGAVLDDG